MGAWTGRALEAGVAVEPLGPYCRLRPQAGLVLGYGAIAASRIDEGVARLARSLRGTAKTSARRG